MSAPRPLPNDVPPAHPPAHPPAEHVAHHTDTGAAPPVAPASTRRVVIGVGVAAVVLLALFVATTLPRRAVGRELAATVAEQDAPTPVLVSTVRRADAAGELTVPGTIQPLHEAVIYARVPGYVKQWHADLGALVHSGDVLAEIDAPELRQEVAQAEQQLSQAQAALGLAKADLARWRDLASDGAVSKQELDQKQAAFATASASAGGAEANLRRLQEQQQFTRVRAPFTGVVTARNVDVGSLITAAGATSATVAGGNSAGEQAGAASLFRVAQTDTVRTYLPVPEGSASAVRVGMSAELDVQAVPGRRFTGRVVRTARAVNAASRTLLAEVDVDNPGAVLLPGMYARARLSLAGGSPALVIPSSALVVRQGGAHVMVVDMPNGAAPNGAAPNGAAPNGEGVIHLRPVTVGRDYGATVEILDGAPEGTTIVTNPNADMSEGARVRVTTPAAPRAAPPR